MAVMIKAVRGMHDILPDRTAAWRHVEAGFEAIMRDYGYREIRTPIVEKSELFVRTVGETSDIVAKEMYGFLDRNDERLCLRPEGTASCVRACIENGVIQRSGPQRLWYGGPMFRRERPQQGRYRQFHQFGVETFGMRGPDIDAELLFLTDRLWRRLGVRGLELQINSLGTLAARAAYRQHLVDYFTAHRDVLDEDSRRRLEVNPLRILDSKNPAMQPLIAEAPSLLEHLDADSRADFDAVCALLDERGIAYRINPRLVRGLDYYEKLVFEWVGQVGAQSTVCAGGRYDGLVAQLGGPATPAAGFALGIERLLAQIEASDGRLPEPDAPHAYLILAGERVMAPGLGLAERLRDENPGLRLLVNCGGGGFKNQFKRADRSGAELALILGEDELDAGQITIKYLRREGEQHRIPLTELKAHIDPVLCGR